MEAKKLLAGAFVSAFCLLSASPATAFSVLSTAWDPGPNVARSSAGNPAPGSATWSVMAAGRTVDPAAVIPEGGSHGANLTAAITTLGGFTLAQYETLFNAAFNTWAAVSGWTNLGRVADGGANAGALQANNGHLGDIRIAAWEITTAGVLAHAFQPGTQAFFGPGGTIAGDVHFDVNRTWVNDANDAAADPDFDLFTVALHEFGHALGLGHSSVVGSVMEPIYAGGRRHLHADDIAGIQAIYGPIPEPEIYAMLAAGLGLMGFVARRRKQQATAA